MTNRGRLVQQSIVPPYHHRVRFERRGFTIVGTFVRQRIAIVVVNPDLKALGDTHKPGAILPNLKPFSLERFLLLRQIVVNCFNSKEINSVHLMA